MENKDACPPVFTEVFEQYVAPQHHTDVPKLTEYMNTVFSEGFGGEQTIGAMLEYAKDHHARADARVEDVIQFALKPRFDPGFTKDITHLIKIPYTIHRDTGKLCVPLKPGLRPSTAMKYTEAFLIDNPFGLL
jgi:DNA primase catalytic subunit